MAQSLRRYLTQSELAERQTITSFDNNILIKAEIDIDNLIASFYQGAYRKSNVSKLTFTSTNTLINGTTCTITNANFTDNFLAYNVLEILDGANAGKKFSIKSNTNNVLTFWETTNLTNVNAPVLIYQLGKAPFVCDTYSLESKYHKTINEAIKDAVAFQYVFRVNNPNLDDLGSQTAYEVARDSYREEFDSKAKNSITNRISPQALDLIKFLMVQTI